MKDQLAMRVKNGDEQAFELLFRRYYMRLCGFANKYFNDHEEAREVVQEVFTKIWEGREIIDSGKSLQAYLFAITSNICINRLRRRKIESKYIEIYKLVYADHKEFTPYESLLGCDLDVHIGRALNKLTPKCRRIFELSRVKGLKYREIAETLQISVKTVETQMSKVLVILRLELKEYL